MLSKSLVRVPGYFTGVVRLGGDVTFSGGDILAVPRIESNHLPTIRCSRVVIVEIAEIPPHIGVFCRMCGIPIILSSDVKDLSGRTVRINGLTGEWETNYAAPLPETILPAWKEEHSLRHWQVSVCEPTQVSTLSKASFPLTFFVRHEFLWMGTSFNPFQCLELEGEKRLEDRVYAHLAPFAKVMDKRHRFHFRSIDARADEFDNLQPSASLDKSEHGLALTLQYPGILRAEMRACQRIAENFDLKVVYSFPYVGAMEELKGALTIVRSEKTVVSMGAFVETPEFAQEVQADPPQGVELFIGTKDLASLFCGYSRGLGDSDRKNPLIHPQFRLLVEKITSIARDRVPRCYYFCFLEHLEESSSVLSQSVGFSVCAYEFSLLARIHLPHLYESEEAAV